MFKDFTFSQWVAFAVAIQFFIIVIIGHIPLFTDSNGYLFGFYSTTFFVDTVHTLSGITALIAAFISARVSWYYFIAAASLFGSDVLVSLLFSRDITETGSLFTQSLGSIDISVHNIIANTPHIALSAVLFVIAYVVAQRQRI